MHTMSRITPPNTAVTMPISTATIIGMIPITLYDETWEGLGASLIFGLITSTVLTLVLVPIVFNLLFSKDAERENLIKELQLQNLKS